MTYRIANNCFPYIIPVSWFNDIACNDPELFLCIRVKEGVSHSRSYTMQYISWCECVVWSRRITISAQQTFLINSCFITLVLHSWSSPEYYKLSQKIFKYFLFVLLFMLKENNKIDATHLNLEEMLLGMYNI